MNQEMNNQEPVMNTEPVVNEQPVVNPAPIVEPQPVVNPTPVVDTPKKGNKKGLIIILLLVVVGGVVAFLFLGKDKGSNSSNGKKDPNMKEITYHNPNGNSNDKLGIVFAPSNMFYGVKQKVFYGVDGKNFSNTNLKGEVDEIENDAIKFSEFNKNDEVSFTIKETSSYTNIEVEYGLYCKEDKEEFDDHEIVYKDKNFFITKSYTYYDVFYVFSRRESIENCEDWYALEFTLTEDFDEAKEYINKYRKNTICIIEDDNYKECTDENGKKIDVSSYRYYDDLLLYYLQNLGLYLDSYDQIEYLDYGDMRINYKVDDNTKYEFKLSDTYESKYKEKAVGTEFDLNGQKWIMHQDDSRYDVYFTRNNEYYYIYFYKSNITTEEAIEIFKSAFTKYK